MRERTDRSKSDPDVASKLAEVARQQEVQEMFPLVRVEIIALETQTRLDSFLRSMKEEELDQEGSDDDVLMGVYNNDQFVKTEIAPLVQELLDRTSQTVFLVEGIPLGYAYDTKSEDEDEGEEGYDGVHLAIDDSQKDYFSTIDWSSEIQQVWDRSEPPIRLGMKMFAQYSKKEIIGRFYDYVQEYANP